MPAALSFTAVTKTSATASLSSPVQDDWAHWTTSTTPSNRKSGGGSTISGALVNGGSAAAYGNDPRTITWSDGTPDATGSSTDGIYNNNFATPGAGVSVTLPATTSRRTARVYFGYYDTNVTISASLSDSSASPISNTTTLTRNTDAAGNGYVEIEYEAGSTGQTLTVSAVINDDYGDFGNTTIQAASWAASSGGDTADQAESITLSDSQTASLNSDVATTESITLSDAVSASADFASALSESITLADSVSSILGFLGDISETVSFSDSVDSELSAGAISEETITFDDSIVGVLTAFGVVDEGISLEDVVTAASEAAGEVTETLSFTDSVLAEAGLESSLTESMTLDDSVESSAIFVGSLTESVTFTDSVLAVEPGEVAVIEQLELSDSAEATLAAQAAVDESIIFQDVVWRTPDVVPASTGGGWAPQLPRRKREKPDRILDDILEVLAEQGATDKQVRKARQTVHRVVQTMRPETFSAMEKALDIAGVEEKIVTVVKKAVQTAKVKRRKKQDEEIMMML